MTQKQIETAKAYLAAGLDLNRTAAIMMIGRDVIEQHVTEVPKLTKSKKVNKNEDL